MLEAGPVLRSAENAKPSFDLPADTLERSVKRFAAQSGLEVLIPGDSLSEVRTQTVRGTMTSRQALDAMLAGTGLAVLQDPKSGAFAIRKKDTGSGATIPKNGANSQTSKKKVMNPKQVLTA